MAADLEVRIRETGARIEVGELPGVQADPAQMRQLMQNLVGNALKFHKQDAAPQVRVHADGPPPPADEDVSASERAETKPALRRIIVEGNGIGFDPKYVDRIFGVFQRLHGRGAHAGSGIGLAVCRRIVERHGGSIEATGAPVAGARFTITLPGSVGAHQEEGVPA